MQLFETKAYLNRGYVGGITYAVPIHEEFDQLEIKLKFNKREVIERDENLKEISRKALEDNIGKINNPQIIEDAIQRMKAEINFLVFLNDNYLGSAHRDDNNKVVLITKDSASLGFSPFKSSRGMLKIVLNVISIVSDETEYQLNVVGRSN